MHTGPVASVLDNDSLLSTRSILNRLSQACPERPSEAGAVEEWAGAISSLPARLAIVLAILSTRWNARAESWSCCMAERRSDCPVAPSLHASRTRTSAGGSACLRCRRCGHSGLQTAAVAGRAPPAPAPRQWPKTRPVAHRRAFRRARAALRCAERVNAKRVEGRPADTLLIFADR